jgi:hypothetical protein
VVERSGRGGGGASDGAIPVLVVRAVWVLLERGAGAEEASAADAAAGAEGQRRCLGGNATAQDPPLLLYRFVLEPSQSPAVDSPFI